MTRVRLWDRKCLKCGSTVLWVTDQTTTYFDADNAAKDKEGEEDWEITCGKCSTTWWMEGDRHLSGFEDKDEEREREAHLALHRQHEARRSR